MKSDKKDLDQQLEELKKLTQRERGVLGGLYNDFFHDVKETHTLPKETGAKTGGETSADAPDLFSDFEKVPGGSVTDALAGAIDDQNRIRPDIKAGLESSQDALKRAQDALDEAKNLFGAKKLVDLPEENAPVKDAPAEEEPPKEQEPEEDPMDQLNSLIGLTTIKRDVAELIDFVKIQKMRQDQGLKSVPVSLHLVFTGNPGTGKTTVARIIGKLYKKIGVLSKGQLVEVDRSGLVAGYVGQTAIKTQEQIKKAMGGVLFIDEAYALAQKDDAFGQEAIDTILKAMEDNRKDLVVIVAGYTKPMEKFINSNPGLKSRFNKYIEFPDYTIDELMGIFHMNCKKYDYVLDEDVEKHIREMLVAKKLSSQENFANAREVRNMFEDIVTNQARRVARMEQPTGDDMMKITLDDLTDEEEEAKAPEGAADAKMAEKELTFGEAPKADEGGEQPDSGEG